MRQSTSEPSSGIHGATAEHSPGSKSKCLVRARAILLALILVPVNLRWIAETEIVYHMYPTYFVPFYNTLVTVFLLALANIALRRIRMALTAAEMLVIFLVLNAASALMSHNFMEILVFMLPFPERVADTAGPWHGVFTGHIPPWLLVTDPVAVKNFYEGNSSIYLWENLRSWIIPCAIWTAFVTVLIGVMVCMTSILRKQWVEHERLSFPIVPMYVGIMDERAGLLRSRMMWLGFAIAGGLTLWNGFAYVYPWLPGIDYKPQAFDSLFQVPPWDCLMGTRFGILFSTVAIAFFMPLDLSVSCWLFYLIYLVQRVLFAMYALPATTPSGMPNYTGLAFGTYLGVFVLGVWYSRRHISGLLRMAIAPGKQIRDASDPLTPREAVLGLVMGLLLLSLFARWIGMALWAVPVFFGVYVVLATMITRIRSEFSFPVHDLHWMGPQYLLQYTFGSAVLGPGTLSALSMFYFFNRVYASHPMPHLMEALKMDDSIGAGSRRLAMLFILATVLGAVVTFWACLDVVYTNGAATAKVNAAPMGLPQGTLIPLDNTLRNPTTTDGAQVVGVATGLFSALGLGALRRTFAFFPLHPLGLAMAPSWAMWFLWMSMLVGSIAKAATMKLGGLKTYRQAVPFFMGALIGEFVVGGLWTVAGIIFHVRTYSFFE